MSLTDVPITFVEELVEPASFIIDIASGKVAIAKRVFLNGNALPNVRSVTVRYAKDQPRTVIVEILATDVREIEDA